MSRRATHRPPARVAGLGLVEVLVALAIFAVVMGIVLTIFSGFGKATNTESGEIDMQQAARVSVDELARNIQQTGYGIDRGDGYNPAEWQRDVVFAGPYVYAFNADIDPAVGRLALSQTVTFPGGDVYVGEGTSVTLSGAETYVYTIDANADGQLTLADRTEAAPGSYNPAAETPNPLDFGLFRRVLGFNGSDFGGALVPVSALLFTNATSAVSYPEGGTPDPLFTYLLTEDLNDDGILDGTECVVGTCPPTTSRAPGLYVWGDTNFDSQISEIEKEALRLLPVGSPGWSGNRLATGGAYVTSPLTQPVVPGASGASDLHVADASRFAVGAYVTVGQAGNTESFVVEAASSASGTVSLGSDPRYAHAAGEPVVVMGRTFLRAIRSVHVNFQAISPRKDTEGGAAAVGRMGRRGTRGLDYRVTPLRASIELRNLVTDAFVGSFSTTPVPTCPVAIAADCAGSAIDQLPAYFPTSQPTTLVFVVKDAGGRVVSGVPVAFSHSDGSLGALSATTAKTDGNGKALVSFTPSGTVGNDVITATATCADAESRLLTYATMLTVKTSRVDVELGNDCLATVLSGVPRTATWRASVRDASGTVSNAPLRLGLSYDPASLPDSPDYGAYEAELFVGADSRGVVDRTGAFLPVDTDTGSGGLVDGSVRLNRDDGGRGVRVRLDVTPAGSACTVASSPTSRSVSFYSFSLGSTAPAAGCTEESPCTIPAGARTPTVAAVLTLNQAPVSGATVTFTKTDLHVASPPGSSTLFPPSAPTDASGNATTTVGNSGAATITVGTPLLTTLDASSTGAASCVAGDIQFDGLRPQFRFEGYAGECGVDMQQAWLVRNGGQDKLCTDVKNTNASGGCAMQPVGFSAKVYKTDGTADANYKIERIEGGAVTTAPGCSVTNKLVLFDKTCNGSQPLLNGQRWDFANVGICKKPTNLPQPGQYLVLNLIDWIGNLVGTGRAVEITIHYACTGICPTVPFSRTFRLLSPAS